MNKIRIFEIMVM